MQTLTISSQRFIDDEIVKNKLAASDFAAMVSPEFEFEGQTLRILLDGHHSMEAAKRSGAVVEYTEATMLECDALSMLESGDVELFLEAMHLGDDWYDVSTGRDIW